jgi:trans-aconitate methyltransferase
MTDFSKISQNYENDSIVQKSASQNLLELLDIQESDNVLDLGCGTGHISALIKGKTNAQVVGVDPAAGMIEKAIERYGAEGISFHHLSVEQLEYQEHFEIIFCNSAFQWFKNPEPALQRCYDSLKYNGRIAIQAPARERYCPCFLEAIEAVKTNPQTKKIFAGFSSPWLFLETAQDYKELFERAGFNVKNSTIVRVTTNHLAEEVYKIFESGAAAGYLNQKFYTTKLTSDYVAAFKKIVSNVFHSQASKPGSVELVFFRIYLLGVKEKS